MHTVREYPISHPAAPLPAQRIIFCDFLRVFATIAVIFTHVSANNWNTASLTSSQWIIPALYNSCVRWAVPVFTMISGTLFLRRDISIAAILSRHVFRLAVAYCFWSVIYAFYSAYCGATFLTSVIESFYHMWYIPLIIGLYLLLPMFKMMVSSRSLTEYFLLLCLVFCSLIPTVELLSSNLLPYEISSQISILCNKIKPVAPETVLGYGAYYVLGYYLSQKELSARIRHFLYFAGIAGVLCTMLLTIGISHLTQFPCHAFLGNYQLNALIVVIAIYVFFQYNTHRFSAVQKWFAVLSKYCFGIYLVHALIVKLMDQFGYLVVLSSHPLVSVPAISTFVFAVSFCISWCLRRLPVLGKFIV